ncbi:MAG TPA: ACT domain-containing protein [Ktedonobacterales bacterium]|jgi:uncharacterized protein|nr:ACT domain-containing protein [Ktedonobacterales bacterium]
MNLVLLPDLFAVCRLDSTAPLPAWAIAGTSALISVTRTASELSIVCTQENVPEENVRSERDWRCLMVEGPLDFSLTGVLSALLAPLADAGVSIFALSTFDTDYLLVRAAQLDLAIESLTAAGHLVAAAEPSR